MSCKSLLSSKASRNDGPWLWVSFAWVDKDCQKVPTKTDLTVVLPVYQIVLDSLPLKSVGKKG
jgi:hypothetical protein